MNKIKKITTMVLIILLILLFAIIFNFSNQDAEKSKGVSRAVTNVIATPIIDIQQLEGNEKEQLLSKANSVVRKIAHFSLYASVGALSMAIMVIGTKLKTKNKILCALSIGVIYAISDEIHQIFTDGRTGLITDIFIDSLRGSNRFTYNINYCQNI